MKSTKRRTLVLTSEDAGHPFRRSLPPHVLAVPVCRDADADAEAARLWKLNGGDWQRFLAAYCASFVAIFAFIL
ncbi:hypothetical protein HT136_06865 [Novosphingobium profundi]|uniref:hypothetical protein n=1 Tax=Novosphingobium profundi TaxID=1774954 RepID=UPI001BD95AF7|nr:hypothetical protein [Novosphingobium profundi]MBT0668087.1 hypothetical protein [Novosphingobium profundi]